ncbi:hypothetical protein [Amycolatopsis jejuensis]|uniref:hypothetical protein n=1 Tax=Amycolatopsis jejuensis TaxID=330084 RepID=UPI000524452E|nr:hypothetical protein [Amycolatopsis jejuensis]
MVYSGAEIYQKLHANPSTTQRLDLAQQASERLMNLHKDLAKSLTDAQKSLDSFWKGKSSETAAAGLAPLIQTSNTAAEHLNFVQLSMYSQQAKFHSTKDDVVPVDNNRPDDNKLSDWISFGASDDEKRAAQFDSDTQKNRDVYESYYQMTTGTYGPEATKDYPAAHDPSVAAGGVTPDPIVPGTGPAGGERSSGSGGHSSNPSGGPSHSYSSGPSTYTPPHGAAGMPAPPSPGSTPVSNIPAPPTPTPDDRTSASWANPMPTPPGTQPWQNPAGSGTGSTGFGPGSGNSNFVGGFGPTGSYGPGGSGGFQSGGRSSGFGPDGSGSGARGGGIGGRGVGSGSGTGSGALGEGAATGRPGTGAAGGTGAKGQPGMGGMGSSGRGGKGSEDEEHQRKILLSEDDPDSIFGGYDGDRPTPPVIGA